MEKEIKIFACGDFYAKHVEGLSFGEKLLGKIDAADLCVCNFEGSVRAGGAKAIPKSGISLSQDIKTPSYLENIGFDVLLCANNHIMDYGPESVKYTLDLFKKAILVGVGTAEEAYEVKKINIKGKTVGFISLVQKEFGVIDSSVRNKGLKEQTIGAAWVCSPELRDIFSNAKKEVDYLLVFPHAGIEHVEAPLPEWREVYKRFIDWGADAVIASHPHVPQGWEIYKECPIYYSLGNFYFDTLKGGKWWYKGLAVELVLGEKVTATVVNTKFSELSVDLDESDEVLNHNEFINMTLNDEMSYNSFVEKISKNAYNGYVYGAVRSVGAISFNVGFKYFLKTMGSLLLHRGNKNSLLNILQCESHRWLFERAIKNGLKMKL